MDKSETRECKTCHESKILDKNHFRFRTDTGKFRTECLECQAKVKHQRYLQNRNRHLSQVKHRYTLKRGEILEYNKQYRELNNVHLRAKSKAKYKLNPEPKKLLAKTWIANNPKRHSELTKAWRAANPTKANASTTAWYKKHPEALTAKTARRRARKAEVINTFTKDEWLIIKQKFNYKCLRCGKAEPDIKLTADHIVPLVSKGDNAAYNIQPLCKVCNSIKGTKTIDYRNEFDINACPKAA